MVGKTSQALIGIGYLNLTMGLSVTVAVPYVIFDIYTCC